MPVTSHDLRCACPRHTKLGVYGRNARGEAYLHIRVHKGDRVFGEIVTTAGVVTVLCRDCGRWTSVRIHAPEVAVERDVARPLVLT